VINVWGCIATKFVSLCVRLFEKKSRFLVAQLRLYFGCGERICVAPKNSLHRTKERGEGCNKKTLLGFCCVELIFEESACA